MKASEVQVTLLSSFIVFVEWTRLSGWAFDSNAAQVYLDDPVMDAAPVAKGLTIQYLLKPLKDESWQRDEEACTDSISYNDVKAEAIARRALKVQIGYTQESFKPREQAWDCRALRTGFYRSLEVWGVLSTQDIQRGLKATVQGKRSIAGLLGAANNHGLTKNQDGKWKASSELLERSHVTPLPIAGIQAARSRALQLKKKA